MIIKRQVLYPAYYPTFSCIGGDCEDNCCTQSWRIYVDKNSYMRYKKIKDPQFAENMSKCIKRIRGEQANEKHYAELVLVGEEHRCPYQKEDGLCEIHADYGAKFLCITCQVYPRLLNQVQPDLIEFSLVMSCPEVVRKALLSQSPMIFQTSEMELDTTTGLMRSGNFQVPRDATPDQSIAHAWTLRETCIDMMQNRQLSLAERLLAIGLMLKKVTELEEQDRCQDIPQTAALYSRASKSGELAGILDQFSENEVVKASVSSLLFELVSHHAQQNNKAYGAFNLFWDRFMEEFKEQVSEAGEYKLAGPMYLYVEKKAEQHWAAILEQYGHVLENYFVSFMFSAVFPFKFHKEGLSPYHHFIMLAEQYVLFRMLLCGNAGEDGVSQEELVRTVTSVAHMNQHSQDPAHVIKAYKERQYDDLAHMSFLLR